MRRKELIEELNGVWEQLLLLAVRAPRRYKEQVETLLQAVDEVIVELEKQEMGVRCARREGEGVSEEVRCPKCRVAMNTFARIWCGWVYRCPTCGYERWPKPKKKSLTQTR